MYELCFNTMNRSAMLLGGEDPDLAGQIAAAGRAGFECIGPDTHTIEHFLEAGGSLADLSRLISAAGLRTFELPTLIVDSELERVQRDVASMLEVAEVLRPDFIQVNVTSDFSQAAIDGLRWAADGFASCGARLAVEYLPWLPGTRNLETSRDLLNRADIAGAGILVDTWHFFMSDDTWEILEALPLEEVAYVQFDDHPKLVSDDLVVETLGRRAMPGEGEFDLSRFCECMRSKGYQGPISCEILSDATRQMPRDEFARRVHDSSRKFWPRPT